MVDENNPDQVLPNDSDDLRPCCPSQPPGGDCCSAGAGENRRWKTVIFVVVILAACAVAAHSLMTKSDDQTNTSKTDASFVKIDLKNPSETPVTTSTEDMQPITVTDVFCGVSLDSINSLPKLAAEKKATTAFIFLPGEDEKISRSVSHLLEKVVNNLAVQDKPVAAFTLKKNAEGYNHLIEQLSLKSLPSVIVTAQGRSTAVVSGQITESNLLAAFVKASAPVSCGPSACGPSDPRCAPPTSDSKKSK